MQGYAEVRSEEITGMITKAIADNPVIRAEAEVVLDEALKILAINDKPGAFEGLINGIAKGRIQTKPNWARVAGANMPKHLEKAFYQDMQKALLNSKKRAAYLRNKPTELRNAVKAAARKYSPNLDKDIDNATDTFITEMNFWVGKGLKTEDAMARAMGVYTTRIRKITALRGVNQAIRDVNPKLADVLDSRMNAMLQDAAVQDASILNAVIQAGGEFTNGVMLRRIRGWAAAFDDMRRLQAEEATKAGVMDIGMFGNEMRGGMGVTGQLGMDDLISGADGLGAFHGPAEWYLNRMARPGAIDAITSKTVRVGKGKKQLLDAVKKLRDDRGHDLVRSTEFGGFEANRIFMNYGMTGDIDFMMKWIMPWQFWPTRAWPRYLELLARKPYLGATFSKIEQKFEENEEELIRLKDKIPLPFLGTVGEMGVPYFDPIRLFVPQDLMNALIFDDEQETLTGQIRFQTQRAGLGLNPFLDAAMAVSGVGQTPYSRIVSLPPGMNLLGNKGAVRLGKVLGFTDARQARVTYKDTRRVAQELDFMLASGDITNKELNEAILEWNEVFPQTSTPFGTTNPTITNPTLNEAWSRVANRSFLEEGLGFFLGLATSFDPPGRKDRFELKNDNAEAIAEAFKQMALGNNKPLEELYDNPEISPALAGRAGSTSGREANRWLARNAYYEFINPLDEELDKQIAQLDPFDPQVAVLKTEASGLKKAKLQELMKTHGLSEEEIVGSQHFAADVARVNQKLIEGLVTPREGSKAINYFTTRAAAKTLSFDPDIFLDQDEVFDGVAYHNTLEAAWLAIPSSLRELVDKWKKRDATIPGAVKTAWEDLYISVVYSGMDRINEEMDKEDRSIAIEVWKESAILPSDREIISKVAEEYPHLATPQTMKFLEEWVAQSYLPNFEKYSLLSTQEDIDNLKANDRKFRSSNDTLVDKSNVKEFEQAWEEFTIWRFAKSNDLPRRGLWTDLVEKYWGSGLNAAETIRDIADVDSRIDRILTNADIQNDEDIAALLEANPDLVALIQLKKELEDDVEIEEKRSNYFNRRTTSMTGSSQGSLVTTMSQGGVGLVLASGKPEWIMEIGNALREGRTIDPQIAAELHALYKKHNMGIASFDVWLRALYEKWINMGKPGAELVSLLLGQAAKQLSPGETVGTIE
jgi:hypothetical protein